MAEDIHLLVAKYLFGNITEEEEQKLFDMLDHDHEAAERVERLANAEDLAKRYTEYNSIDKQTALQHFLDKYFYEENSESTTKERPRKRIITPVFLRYAAVIALLVVGGAFLYFHEYTRITPPEIPDAIRIAMQQSQEKGKQGAIEKIVSIETMIEDEREELENTDLPSVSSYNMAPHPRDITSSDIQKSLSKEQLLAARKITTLHDKEFWLTLDDGTLVHLNYNTHLVYPEKFGKGDRNVILDGEAYFMIAKDRSRPFIVHTPDGEIKVYGTEFNVNTRSDMVDEGQEETTVVLVKGSVSVTPLGGKEQMLQPGKQCRISNTQCMIKDVDIEPYVAWNTGTFAFENIPITKLMNVISRWYGYELTFMNQNKGNRKFTGELDKYSSIEPVIEAVQQVTGLEIIINGQTIIIKN